MIAVRLPSGNILAPMRAETDDLIGDAMIELFPADDAFAEWDGWLNQDWWNGKDKDDIKLFSDGSRC